MRNQFFFGCNTNSLKKCPITLNTYMLMVNVYIHEN